MQVGRSVTGVTRESTGKYDYDYDCEDWWMVGVLYYFLQQIAPVSQRSLRSLLLMCIIRQ